MIADGAAIFVLELSSVCVAQGGKKTIKMGGANVEITHNSLAKHGGLQRQALYLKFTVLSVDKF